MISLMKKCYVVFYLIWCTQEYIDEIIGAHQCGFWFNRWTTDQILCICQILEKKMGIKWDSTLAINRLQDFSEEGTIVVLYNILIEIGIPMKLVRLIKMCLNETYSKVHIRKHLSDSFSLQNGLK
jgi:hypothetical protein